VNSARAQYFALSARDEAASSAVPDAVLLVQSYVTVSIHPPLLIDAHVGLTVLRMLLLILIAAKGRQTNHRPRAL
jgi:hypothetical protein